MSHAKVAKKSHTQTIVTFFVTKSHSLTKLANVTPFYVTRVYKFEFLNFKLLQTVTRLLCYN
jgi:hypothetical protein